MKKELKKVVSLMLATSVLFTTVHCDSLVTHAAVQNEASLYDEESSIEEMASVEVPNDAPVSYSAASDLSGEEVVTSVEKLQSAHDYSNNMDKYWVFSSMGAAELKVTFSSDTSLENGADYIYLYDKNDTQIGRYTGQQLSNKTVTVAGDEIKIRLVTDESNVDYGFRVSDIITMDSISVSAQPTKVSYVVGQNPNYDGLKIAGNYSDGSSKEIVDGYELSEVDTSTEGTKLVTVIYCGLTCDFSISYHNIVVESISVKTNPNKMTYTLGEELDTTGLVLEVTDSEGEKHDIDKGFTVLGFDSTTVGTKTLTITLSEKTVTLDIEVSYPFTFTTKAGNVTVTGVSQSNITDIVIPETINGDTVTEIAASAFKNQTMLAAISLPDGLKKIGASAFEGCTGITKIVVPDTVNTIGEAAFKGTKVESITLPFVGGTKEPQTVDIWKFQNVFGYIFGYESTLSSYSNTSSSGAAIYQYTYYNNAQGYVESRYKIYRYYIPSTLKEIKITNASVISDNAFYNCSGVERISLNNGITSIGSNAFYNCSKLKEIVLMDSLEVIGSNALKNCNDIKVYANKDTAGYQYAINNGIKVSSTDYIELDKNRITLYKGETENITATVYMLNGNIDVTPSISWVSSNQNIVKVVNGEITVVGPGTATITADSGGKTDTCKVTVYYLLESISLDKKSATIDVGETTQFSVLYSPSNTTDNKSITWSSSDTNVAGVSQTGEVTAKSKGTATITAASVMGPTVSATVDVLLPISAMELSESTVKLEKSASTTLDLTVLPADTTDTYRWSSENDQVATITQTGKVTAVDPGSTNIVVTSSRGKTVSCRVDVIISSTKVSILPHNSNIFVDDLFELETALTPIDSTDSIEWSSTNPGVISVDENGLFCVEGAGEVMLTAKTTSGETASTTIHVSNDINNATISLNKNEYQYTGDENCPLLTVKYNDKILEKGVDYSLEYTDNVGIGTAKVIISGIGRYSGEKELSFTIKEHKLADSEISLNKDSFTYTGKEIKANIEIVVAGHELTENIDYTLEYSNNVNIGTAKVIITGIGNFTGFVEKKYKINAITTTDLTIQKGDDPTYTGKRVCPTLDVKWDNVSLTEGIDYSVSDSSGYKNINAGYGSIDVIFKGNYSGTKTVTFSIKPVSVSELSLNLDNTRFDYSGTAIKPEVVLKDGTTVLIKDIDYTVSYSNNTNIGTGTVSVSGKGNYAGSKSVTFTISGVLLKSVSVEKSSYGYTGSALRPIVTVKDSNGERVASSNYSVVYKNNVKNGTATVSVTGRNNCKGTVETTFKIVPTVEKNSVSVYVGTNKKITVKSSDKISYSTSKKSVATVNLKGIVVGKKKGSAKITIKTGGKTFKVKVIVKNPSLSAKKCSVYSGDTYKLSVNGGTGAIKWTSSNTSVATVKKGKFKTKKPGCVTIKAVRNGVTMSCKVKVNKSSLSKKSISLYTGYSDTLSVKGISGNPKWKSSNTKVVTVDSKGVVKAVKAGTANITATYGGVNYICKVTVKETTYGSVSGNVSWYYNKYQGNKPDIGAFVYLISTSGSAKSMPTMSFYVDWKLTFSMKKYQQYGVYMTQVDGNGNYKFNRIPTGEYRIVIISKNTISETAFDDKDAYVSMISGWVSPYINKTNADYLGECCGYQKVKSDIIDVYEREDANFSYNFGTTYI